MQTSKVKAISDGLMQPIFHKQVNEEYEKRRIMQNASFKDQ